jgi:hypothetical protein
MAIHSTNPAKTYWLVNEEFTIEHIKNQTWAYIGERGGLFDSFEEAQDHLLSILKADHAQVIADIATLPAKLKVIEAKIRIVNVSSEQDYQDY